MTLDLTAVIPVMLLHAPVDLLVLQWICHRGFFFRRYGITDVSLAVGAWRWVGRLAWMVLE